MSRLVLVVPAFPQLSETFIASKVAGLLERGWDVHVVCRDLLPENAHRFGASVQRMFAEGRVHAEPRLERTPVGALRAATAVAGAAAAAPWRTASHWRRALRAPRPGTPTSCILDSPLVRLAPSLVHFEFGTLALGRAHTLVANDMPYSLSFRGYDVNFHRLRDGAIYGDVCRGARGVHVLGEDIKRRAIARGCPPDARFAVIPPAIDVDFFCPGDEVRPVHTGTRRLRILAVGRLEWKKGYEHAIEAIRQLVARGWDVEYRIVGDGGHVVAISVAVDQAGLGDRVTLLGKLGREAVRDELRAADLFLHAAVSEGFCNAVLEAQAVGCPVVVTNADGLAENVAHGETGLVVPTYDAPALANAMEELLRDAPRRGRMGQEGRARVASNFRIERQIDRWEQFYGELGLSPLAR
ncbi:glycosyltransferase family 4 protein [Gemmatimonas sp.]|uniref:glycosyltransferase family 4 protein n=1 Tax=Gemmatimonas sp. TaxID=1962908 RepID=UPI0022BC8836|nr:glycosyltransferase family 4 protein [Gemmatimonas sp.]MCZ8204289.1 glycosyltransferase family 4 protein [Gemmatimonas sp.]